MEIIVSILYKLIILPIEYLMDIVCYRTYQVFNEPVITLLVLSVFVNVITIPLYSEAERIQNEGKDERKYVERWTEHISRTFRGDERIMIRQYWYRISGNRPTRIFAGLAPLALQIPFFMAAYYYVADLRILEKVSFLCINDLSMEDRIINTGSITVNILPVVMTAINIISSFVYISGQERKKIIQPVITAVVFLILLYHSPSGLVLYWIFNNLFSLVRNLYRDRIEHKKAFLLLALSLLPVIYVFHDWIALGNKKWITDHNGYFLLICFPILVYLLFPLLRIINAHFDKKKSKTIEYRYFFMILLALTLFMGGLIPLMIVSSSAGDFLSIYSVSDPLSYCINSFLIWSGVFLLWGSVIWLAAKKIRYMLYTGMMAVFFIGLFDYCLYGRKYGTMSGNLVYDKDILIGGWDAVINIFAVMFIFVLCVILVLYLPRIPRFVVNSAVVTMLIISIRAYIMTEKEISGFYGEEKQGELIALEEGTETDMEVNKYFSLDKSGKNVIVLMLDRAISSYIPYMFYEKPELKEQFDGFVYYPDTLSFGYKTIFASAPIFGGYEYTPERMNERDEEPLVDKHDEALRLMPLMFGESDYQVTVVDPSYAGYSMSSDLSIFDKDKNVSAYHLNGIFGMGEANKKRSDMLLERNFVYYSLFRTVPLCFAQQVYDKGNYQSVYGKDFDMQPSFMEAYLVLDNLSKITQISDNGENTALIMVNYTTHELCNLQLPDYTPAVKVDNSEYDNYMREKEDGERLYFSTIEQDHHYKVDMAALIKLGEFFDFMRNEGVYDNTRIIIVSDHGHSLAQIKDFRMMDGKLDITMFNPLLLVKDFDSKGFTTSDEFMTNADVPTIAMEGLLENMVNPFTGNVINSESKKGELYVTASSDLHETYRSKTKTTFDTSDAPWFSVHDSIFDENNWAVWKEQGEESR